MRFRLDLIIRLIAAIPPPRFHLVRYFGVLASHSKFRPEVVPKPPQNSAAFKQPPASGDQLEFPKLNPQTDDARPSRKRWAWLLAHVFRADLETCVHCGRPARQTWACSSTTSDATTGSSGQLRLRFWGYAGVMPSRPEAIGSLLTRRHCAQETRVTTRPPETC